MLGGPRVPWTPGQASGLLHNDGHLLWFDLAGPAKISWGAVAHRGGLAALASSTASHSVVGVTGKRVVEPHAGPQRVGHLRTAPSILVPLHLDDCVSTAAVAIRAHFKRITHTKS